MPVALVPNIKHAMHQMRERGIIVVGADAGSKDLVWDIDLKVPLALVSAPREKGSEKQFAVSVMFSRQHTHEGQINSLNVSVAAGIFAFEILRKRRQNN